MQFKQRNLFVRPPHGLLCLSVAAFLLLTAQAHAVEEAAAVEQRLADAARYLTSDELEGRGINTKGIELAAKFIAEQFTASGLKTDLCDGMPFQKFSHTAGSQLGKANRAALVGPVKGDKPQRTELAVGKDLSPLGMSGSVEFDCPLIFAGYGITAEKEQYDDYASLDVKGKIVVLLRHEPQQSDPKSPLNGTRDSVYAPLRQKVANAVAHGAAGVIFCTDEVEVRKNLGELRKRWHEALDRLAAVHEETKKDEKPTPAEVEAQRVKIERLLKEVDVWNKRLQTEIDPVLSLGAAGPGDTQQDFPVLHCRRSVLDPIVKEALGKDLAALEAEIDETFKPHSGELTGWRIAGKTDLKQESRELKNVVAMIEATGDKAEETIVLGAHYDHIGYGEAGSLQPGSKQIHHGADDNASGVCVVLEVARQLAARPKLPRRVVFVAFTGEEVGLLGSSHYVAHPPVPLDKTIAMINLDMVGRLRDERLTIMGTGTSKAFGEILDGVPSNGLKLTRVPVGAGPSDQLAFYARQIPVLHYYTGMHREYHRPTDTFETLNIAGMRQVAKHVEETIVALAERPERPQFVATPMAKMSSGGRRAYFGSVPDFGSDDGYRLAEVVADGPAAKAGLRAGDAVVEFGGQKVSGLEGFTELLSKYKGGEKVKTIVRRGEETITVEVELGKPR